LASAGVTVDFRVAEREIPDRLKEDIFRNAREGVNNAVKHAAATEIRLTVARAKHGIMLTIADEGIRFDQLNPSDQTSSL
jgi:two-component system NarL family sensor kinase